MKLTKKHCLIAFAGAMLVWGLACLVDQWRDIYASQPIWLNQVIMTMIDPGLPLSHQLRDLSTRQQR